MTQPTPQLLRQIRAQVALAGRLSDGLIVVGPLRLGLDALFSWIPGVAEIYSGVAGAFIVIQASRARLGLPVIAAAAALIGARTLINALPLAGPAAADLFTAHRWAARLVIGAIDRKLAAMGAPTGEPWEGRAAPVQPLAASARTRFSLNRWKAGLA